MILKNRSDPVRLPVVLAKYFELSIFESGKSDIAVTDPPRALAISIKRMDGVARQAILNGISANDFSIAEDLQSVLGTNHQGSVRFFRGCEHRIVRLVRTQLNRLDLSITYDAQSFAGGDPDACIAALVNAPCQVIGHPHLVVIRSKIHVSEPGQPAGLRANPQVAFAVFIDG